MQAQAQEHRALCGGGGSGAGVHRGAGDLEGGDMSKLAHSNEWFMDRIEMKRLRECRRLGEINMDEYLKFFRQWWRKWAPEPKRMFFTPADKAAQDRYDAKMKAYWSE